MANRRMISKSISTSTKLSEVSTFARLLFTWMIPHCDDYGHLDATPKVVKGIVVPLCEQTVDDVVDALEQLSTAHLITLYESEGRRYLEVVQWDEHQTFKNDRPRQAAYPLKELTGIPGNPKGKNVHLSKVKRSKDKIREEKGTSSPKTVNEAVDNPLRSVKCLDDVAVRTDLREKFWQIQDVDGEIEKAKDWLTAKGRKYKNYLAFMRNWLRGTVEYLKAKGPLPDKCGKCGKIVYPNSPHYCPAPIPSEYGKALAQRMGHGTA